MAAYPVHQEEDSLVSRLTQSALSVSTDPRLKLKLLYRSVSLLREEVSGGVWQHAVHAWRGSASELPAAQPPLRAGGVSSRARSPLGPCTAPRHKFLLLLLLPAAACALRPQANHYRAEGNDEQLFVMLFRLATLVVETIPKVR